MEKTRNCQNCKSAFTIDAQDFDFYKKMDVPPPTFCVDCRRQRRMNWRNEMTLYKRSVGTAEGKREMVSSFAPEKPFHVYEDRHWWSDAWDPLAYGAPYDFGKPFFRQFRDLLERVPLINLSITNMVNSSYCNVSLGDKNCYLISASLFNEEVRYGNRVGYNKDAMDVYVGEKNERCYEIIGCSECYRVLFSRDAYQCASSAFLYNCVNCQDCFACANLRNKQYYIFNVPHTKEAYRERMKEFDLGDFATLQNVKKEFGEFLGKNIHRYAHIYKCADVTGDHVENAKNCVNCFDVIGSPSSAEDCKFFSWGGFNTKDSYDVGPGVGAGAERIYDCFDSGIQASDLYFSSVVYGSHHVYYGINCHGSSYLFGCYGLRSKQYCILNKQYSKEEYEDLVPKIRAHMSAMPYRDAGGRVYVFGEFFPAELSPYAYNESISQQYYPLTKEVAEVSGFVWRDSGEKNPSVTKETDTIPGRIGDVTDEILRETLRCVHRGQCLDQCTGAFRIIPEELEFYRGFNVALPRLCPNCRHYERLRTRNPMKLWHRACQCAGEASERGTYKNQSSHSHGAAHCPNMFETSYAPEKPEIVYCESCYQQEVS